jgi:DNA-directed RNA polymerase subunit beta'
MSILSPSNKSSKKSFDYLNKIMNKKELQALLSRIYDEYGGAKTGTLANALKDLGFKYATLAGVTISIDDLTVPEAKKKILAKAEAQIERATHRFAKGEITEVERYSKVIDTWSQATEELTNEVVEKFDRMNPVYMMAFSGARGNISQVRQLVGMRGLMADAQGQIIDLPIKTNFREGLSVTEYIISSYGARKGLVDTALKTADSGYLTRRLVDVAQDVIIEEEDCGTIKGIPVLAIMDGGNVMVSLEERLIGRTSAVDVVDESDGEILVQAGQIITPHDAQQISKRGVKEVSVRSGLTCASQFGVCRRCYGWSLTSNKPVDIGEAIGIMAAQSIGEPGTQLTMRTFHTGGVFSGSTNFEQVKALHDGQIVTSLPLKDFRTRHGDIVMVTTRDVTLEVKTADGKVDKYNLPYNATIFSGTKGNDVKAGEIIAEFEQGAGRGDARRLTEKATKDIKADMPGEIFFEGFDADEKRDRQGNITRTANRAGTIWILGGDVYNLPGGSKHKVENGDNVKSGDILAETMVISEHGGEVRVPADLKTEQVKVGGETIDKIVEGKELTIIIASTHPENATLESTKKEQLWRVEESDETYIIKSPVGTMVENNSIIAELIDESCMAPSSGEIRYEDVEVDEQRVMTKPGTIYFIPEEIHQVSKDASLKMVESGTFVEAGTEVVKDVTTRISGIVDIVEDNDIIQEVVIRPGELYRVDDVGSINVDDGTVVEAGTEVAPGIVANEKSMITINFQLDEPAEDDEELDDMEDTTNYEYAEVLVRPVQEFQVKPHDVSIHFSSTEEDNISIVPVTQLAYKDGDKIRQVEGAPLLRTSLVLQMGGYLSRLKGIVEEDAATGNYKIAVLENLTIRRETSSDAAKMQAATQTQLLVQDGEVIDKRTPVVKTQVLAKNDGLVSLGNASSEKEVRRIMLITDDHRQKVKTNGKPTVEEGDYIRMDDPIAPGESAVLSGKVEKLEGSAIILRVGHPYLISGGTQLQVEHNSLVQRGDLVATLIFERQKSGDIVQGLPRVEELLEGRKSKETAIIASYDCMAELEWEDDAPKLFLVSEDHGRSEVNVPVGANILVEDKEQIKCGQPLTDGSINPHDLIDIMGVEAVRKYLVDEVQRVYRSQGVEIADKHVEIIVRQMSKKVKVDESGDTRLLPGELLDEKVVLAEAARAEEAGGAPPEYHPVLLGITKASLNTDSFISAASFQETTRVLTEAAVEGKEDILRGLKENVIIGRLIPAGTGFPHFKDEREDMIDDQAGGSRFTARKPSAILEEIESMFGSPEISQETLGDLILDDEDIIMDEEDQSSDVLVSDDEDLEDEALFSDDDAEEAEEF